jgi:hypothetical protein
VALNFVLAVTVVVEFTWTSYTRCPPVIAVLAVPGLPPNVIGLEQDVAEEPTSMTAKPLSVAMSPFVTFTADPISA